MRVFSLYRQALARILTVSLVVTSFSPGVFFASDEAVALDSVTTHDSFVADNLSVEFSNG